MRVIKCKIGILVLTSIMLIFPFLTGSVLASSNNAVESLSTELIEIKTRPGVKQKFVLIKPAHPVASVIFLKGGKGLFKFKNSSGKISIGKGKKLFEMLKNDFATQGVIVAVIDAPSDKPKGINPSFRMSKKHTQDVKAIVSYLIDKTKLPVWLFGHSFGTISVAQIGIHAQEGIVGLVFASPVTQTSKKWGKIFNSNPNGIIDMELDKIRVQTLFVYHKDDKCIGTPPSNIPRLKEAVQNSKILELAGGKTQKSKPCGPGAHSFLGIEKEFFATVAEFIKSQ
jgi:hypothetical protein